MAALWGAFWTAVLSFRWSERGSDAPARFLLGLVLGAGLAHLGWWLLHLPQVREHPSSVLDVSRGFTVLAVPVGLLLTAPWRGSLGDRISYLARALRSLPLALAVAKLGCLAAGCCHGVAMGSLARAMLPMGPLHPAALYEILGFLALHAALGRVPQPHVPAAFALGFGAIRLAVEPLRAAPPLGEPVIPAAVLAAMWLVGSVPLVRLLSPALVRGVRIRGRIGDRPRLEERVAVEHGDAVPREQRAQQDGAKLPDVSEPRLARERGKERGGRGRRSVALFHGQLGEERARDGLHVARSLAKRRDVDGGLSNAVVEVAPEGSVPDQRLEVAMRGSDDPRPGA